MAKIIKMTPQAAIEIITNAIQRGNMTAEQDMALAVMQKAIEKQIPKKPINIQTPDVPDPVLKWGTCPVCKGEGG